MDDYREKHRPSDGEVGDVVLAVADFLLEFAIFRHEEMADVPTFVHPVVPTEDLRSLGVPYLSVDEEGNTTLMKLMSLTSRGAVGMTEGVMTPESRTKQQQQHEIADPNAYDPESPIISTYFYNRWMWIQFPYIAVANCGKRYHQDRPKSQDRDRSRLPSPGVLYSRTSREQGTTVIREQNGPAKPLNTSVTASRSSSICVTKSSPSLRKKAGQLLPQVFIRRPSRTREPVLQTEREKCDSTETDKVACSIKKMASELYDDVLQYRCENDMLVQQRSVYERKILDLNNELTDLERTYNGSVSFDSSFVSSYQIESEDIFHAILTI